MSNLSIKKAQDLERLAAWQRLKAAHATALWVWEARLLAAEELERKATQIRADVCAHRIEIAALDADARSRRVHGSQRRSALFRQPRTLISLVG